MKNEIIPMCRICRSTDVGVRQDGSLFCRQCGETVEPCAACGSYDIGEGMNGDAFCRDCGARGEDLSGERESHLKRRVITKEDQNKAPSWHLYYSITFFFLLCFTLFLPFVSYWPISGMTLQTSITGWKLLGAAMDQLSKTADSSAWIRLFGIFYALFIPIISAFSVLYTYITANMKKQSQLRIEKQNPPNIPNIYIIGAILNTVLICILNIFIVSLAGFSDNPSAQLEEGAIMHCALILIDGCITVHLLLKRKKQPNL